MILELGFDVDVRPLPPLSSYRLMRCLKSTSGGGVLAITRVDDRIFAKGTAGPIVGALRQDIGNGCTGLSCALKLPITSLSRVVRRLMDCREMTGQPGPISCLSISMINTQLKIFCDGCTAIWWRLTIEVLSILCGNMSLVHHDLRGNREQQNTAAQQGLFPDRLVKEYPDPKRSKNTSESDSRVRVAAGRTLEPSVNNNSPIPIKIPNVVRNYVIIELNGKWLARMNAEQCRMIGMLNSPESRTAGIMSLDLPRRSRIVNTAKPSAAAKAAESPVARLSVVTKHHDKDPAQRDGNRHPSLPADALTQKDTGENRRNERRRGEQKKGVGNRVFCSE